MTREGATDVRPIAEAVRSRTVTALVCITDTVALGVIESLREAGIRAPKDVSIVGIDGIPLAADARLTTVEQQMEEVGAKAVGLLLDEIEGARTDTRQVTVAPRLVRRQSTGGPPA